MSIFWLCLDINEGCVFGRTSGLQTVSIYHLAQMSFIFEIDEIGLLLGLEPRVLLPICHHFTSAFIYNVSTEHSVQRVW
jgi:hypothetical protein